MKEQIVIEEKANRIKNLIREKLNEGWLYKGTISQYTCAGSNYVSVIMEKKVNNGEVKEVNGKSV